MNDERDALLEAVIEQYQAKGAAMVVQMQDGNFHVCWIADSSEDARALFQAGKAGVEHRMLALDPIAGRA